MVSVEQMLGQSFLCGFGGEHLCADVQEYLSEGFCGGVILFPRNINAQHHPEALCRLLSEIRAVPSPHAPWLAIDQEGGRVTRLKAPFTTFPPAATLGLIGEPEDAFLWGKYLAQEASHVGFQLLFAPVMDVHTNPENPVIGDRALSHSAKDVAVLARAMCEGMLSEGVMPCGKHFPGHGDTVLDSHLALPYVSHPITRLKETEWVPFREAVDFGVPALMTAHVVFTALDTKPATLSEVIVGGMLRGEWGFDGIVCSDDLEMKGLDAYSIEERVVLGYLAGVDLFLLCHTPALLPRAHAALVEAYKDGVITRGRIERSYSRLMRAKQRFVVGKKHDDCFDVRGWLEREEERRSFAEVMWRRWEDRQI
ncbi:MAG: beta-N-acetylhexosaminidase [Deltaproteobacteria bacterium]|nr:beta-N-acetylhexosaminidase [Deltaproteobacteria bacterium]MBU49162.1 beta-N-acetylhexosaminidase [Deltaproteobacteria bacterium]|tara:strand:+ start:12793 stop:13893 length:1101 start_codon:yes stop_codon:yes gene_type:complete